MEGILDAAGFLNGTSQVQIGDPHDTLLSYLRISLGRDKNKLGK